MKPKGASTPKPVSKSKTERSLRLLRRAQTARAAPAQNREQKSKKVSANHPCSDISVRIAQRAKEVRAGAPLNETIVDDLVKQMLINEDSKEQHVEASSPSDIETSDSNWTTDSDSDASDEPIQTHKPKLLKLPTWRSALKNYLQKNNSKLSSEQVVNDPRFIDEKMPLKSYKCMLNTKKSLWLAVLLQQYNEYIKFARNEAQSNAAVRNEINRSDAHERREAALRHKGIKSNSKSSRRSNGGTEKEQQARKRRSVDTLLHPSKYARMEMSDPSLDVSVFESFAQQQRLVTWKFKEFVPSANKAYTVAEFLQYLTEFQHSADMYGIDELQRLTRLHDDSGDAIARALAVIQSRRGPFSSVEEMSSALVSHWKESVDELTCESDFTKQMRNPNEPFVDYLHRLQVDVTKLPTVMADPNKFIKIEQVLLNTIALSAGDEQVELKARSLFNEIPSTNVQKTSRLDVLKKFLKNRDAHKAAKAREESEAAEDDIVAKVDGTKNFNFSGREQSKKFIFQGNKETTNGPKFINKKQFVEESERSERRLFCSKCSRYHFKGPCKCLTCTFHHDASTPCIRCNSCGRVGHKRKFCTTPRSDWPKQNSVTTNSFNPHKEVKAVESKTEEPTKSTETDKVNFIIDRFD